MRIRNGTAWAVMAGAAVLAGCGGDGGGGFERGSLREAAVPAGALTRAAIDALPSRAVVGAAARCDVQVVQIDYRTPGARTDEQSNASGAVLVPTGADPACQGPFPLLAYTRGTETTRGRTMASTTDGETLALASFFAGQGYMVVATDYLGYAKSAYPFHPYLHADSEAASAIDSIRAARRYAQDAGLRLSGRTMVYGYSQGGHSSMATQRAIERDASLATELGLVGAAHGAAPSALGTAVARNDPILFGQVFAPFFITAWQKIYGDVYTNPAQIFNAPYAAGIENLLPNPTQNTGQLFASGALPSTLTPAWQTQLFTPAFLSDVTTNPNNGVVRAAQRNDILASGFTPRLPTLVCHGSADPVVLFGTSTALAQQRWGGLPNVQFVDVNPQAQALGAQLFAGLTPQQQAAAGGTLAGYTTVNYHGTLAPPFCLASARALFDTLR